MAPLTSSRNLCDWQPQEDDALLAAAFLDGGLTTVDHLAQTLKRDRVSILYRIADSEIADMVGLDFEAGSSERAEFVGLALSGAPIETALRWCAAQWGEEAEPAPDIAAWSGGGCDMRPGVHLAGMLGLWFNRDDQCEALRVLGTLSEDEVRQALHQVIDRFDAPTPVVVAQQIFGVAPFVRSYPWATPAHEAIVLDVDTSRAKKAKASCAKKTSGRSVSAYARASKTAKDSKASKTAKASNPSRSYQPRARRARSSSYPCGSPVVDQRTPAERAWESRTHW